MATKTKSIPILDGIDAERFVKIAQKNEKKKGSVDFRKEAEIAKRILSKSKL